MIFLWSGNVANITYPSGLEKRLDNSKRIILDHKYSFPDSDFLQRPFRLLWERVFSIISFRLVLCLEHIHPLWYFGRAKAIWNDKNRQLKMIWLRNRQLKRKLYFASYFATAESKMFTVSSKVFASTCSFTFPACSLGSRRFIQWGVAWKLYSHLLDSIKSKSNGKVPLF